MDEFTFIERLLRPLAAGFPSALELRDDAALLDAKASFVVSADGLVEGIHFPPGVAAGDVASRALRTNLSDLAAMGAEPWCYLLVLALPRTLDERWLTAFTGRLEKEQRTFGIALAGGDTLTTPGPLSVTITAMGLVTERDALRRNGAREGDAILVSGTIGDAHLGLRTIKGELDLPEEDAEEFRSRFLTPEPRIELGMALRQIASAAMDISDGLIADLRKMCEASGTGAIVERDAVPLSKPARKVVEDETVEWSNLTAGGDDHELLVTVAQKNLGKAMAAAKTADTPLVHIGTMTAGSAVLVTDPEGRKITFKKEGYRHR